MAVTPIAAAASRFAASLVRRMTGMEAGKRARPMAELGWKYAQQAGA